MKIGVVYLVFLFLILSNLVSIYAFEVSSEYCGDGIYPSSIGKQCDSSLNLEGSDTFSFYTLDHCNPPGSENECQCASDSISDDNGRCLFCGDGILTQQLPLAEECENSLNCNPPGSFNQCKCVSGYINDSNGNCHQCWGDNLNGQTCKTQGFETGILSCDANGNFNTTACFDCPSGQILDTNGKCICPPGTIPNPAYSSSPLLVSNTINQVITTFTNSLSGTTIPACIDAPIPCTAEQNKACGDKCQVCVDGKAGDCGPNPTFLTPCQNKDPLDPTKLVTSQCCYQPSSPTIGIESEQCITKDVAGLGNIKMCQKMCSETCGTLNCCDTSSSAGNQCKKITLVGVQAINFIPGLNTAITVGYCFPKKCTSVGKLPYNEYCKQVPDNSGKHYLCCDPNTEKCAMKLVNEKWIPYCQKISCPGEQTCTGNALPRPVGVQGTANTPPSPLPPLSNDVPSGTDTSGKQVICCPLTAGCITLSATGQPYCNPRTSPNIIT